MLPGYKVYSCHSTSLKQKQETDYVGDTCKKNSSRSFCCFYIYVQVMVGIYLCCRVTKCIHVTSRVAKCHEYDGYIRIKILASWGKSLREHTILQNEAFLGGDLHNLCEMSLSKLS